MNFKESSYFKGESCDSKPVKRTNVDADKKCFYCKKQTHMIKNCKTRIVAEKGNNNLKQMLLPTKKTICGSFDSLRNIKLHMVC